MGEKALVTITRVETSKDMKWAKVWIDILAADPKITDPSKPLPVKNLAAQKKKPISLDDKILNHINSNIYEIQGELNRRFTTKIVPRLQFVLDLTPRHVQHIDELIKKIHEEE